MDYYCILQWEDEVHSNSKKYNKSYCIKYSPLISLKRNSLLNTCILNGLLRQCFLPDTSTERVQQKDLQPWPYLRMKQEKQIPYLRPNPKKVANIQFKQKTTVSHIWEVWLHEVQTYFSFTWTFLHFNFSRHNLGKHLYSV